MKLKDVLLAACMRVARGENHFCCHAVAEIALGRKPFIGEIYSVPAVLRFLQLAVEVDAVGPSPYPDTVSSNLMLTFKDRALQACGPLSSKEQREAYERDERCALLLKIAALPILVEEEMEEGELKISVAGV